MKFNDAVRKISELFSYGFFSVHPSATFPRRGEKPEFRIVVIHAFHRNGISQPAVSYEGKSWTEVIDKIEIDLGKKTCPAADIAEEMPDDAEFPVPRV